MSAVVDSGAGRAPWEERPSRIGQAGKGTVLTAVCLAVLVPLWVIIVTSLSDRRTIDSAGGLVLWPRGVHFEAYRSVLGGGTITRAVVVSLGVTAVGTLLSITVSVLAAYGLSRTGSFLHRPILFTLMFTMFFSAGMIPTYLLVDSLGLRDSYWSLILPSAISVFNILVLRSFFMSVPQELIDSARIDGAGDWRILARIVLPMSRAVVAVITLFYAVGYWSSWFNAFLYLDHSEKWPLQLVLNNYVLQQKQIPGQGVSNAAGQLHAVPELAMQCAIMVVAVIPVLAVYPFVQKHFTKGMLIGAIKG